TRHRQRSIHSPQPYLRELFELFPRVSRTQSPSIYPRSDFSAFAFQVSPPCSKVFHCRFWRIFKCKVLDAREEICAVTRNLFSPPLRPFLACHWVPCPTWALPSPLSSLTPLVPTSR